MKRFGPAAFAFGGPALVVLLISAFVTIRRGAAAARPQPARFSGSTVVQRLPSLLASPRLGEAISVVVVRDDAAASFYQSSGELESIVRAWRDALAATGADVRVLHPVLAREDRTARVLVVPSSPCLTIETHEAIASAAARGAGLILTGMSGTYDGGCRPLGYGMIVKTTGASRAEVLEKREMTYVTVPSRSPLSIDVPPGARIDLNPGKQVALRHPARDAFYSDYALQPQPARDQPLLDAAMTHSTVSGQRVVYWGFELAHVVDRPWDRALARLLVRNSLAWAASEPIASVEPWPFGKRAAASIAQDVESGFANARHAVDSLRAAGVRSTFFLTTELAQRYERLSRRLAQSGEIGTHGENHRRFGGLPRDEQRARLETTQRDLRDIVGNEAVGLRPPEEQFDTATMSAWLAANGTYLFGANDSRVAAPELLRFGDDTLVLVGRVGSDDFAVAAGRAAVPDSLAAIFLGEYDRVRALGGHYVLSYHSQLLAKPELVPSLATAARTLVKDTAVWLATLGEVADWWRARAKLDADARISGDRIRVTVRNRNDRAVEGAVVRIALPDGRRVARAGAKLLPSDARTVRVAVPPVPAKTTRAFNVFLR